MKVARVTHSGCNYVHSKFSKMAAGFDLGFDLNGNVAIRSADSGENPTVEPNMKLIDRMTRCGDIGI